MILKILIGLVLLVVVMGGYLAYRSSRAAYETAPYTVVRTDGAFELREYPALVVVETPMGEADNSFMRLFRYIDGQNVSTQKIAMTTPVFMTGADNERSMSFVMPRAMKPAEVPQPQNAQVAVGSIPGGTFAVLRFGGRRRATSETEAVDRLAAWMQQENLVAVGEPIFGYFDPPWTPGSLRRNEVMRRVGP